MTFVEVGTVKNTSIHPVKGMQQLEMADGIAISSATAAGDRSRVFAVDGSSAQNTLLDTIKFPGLLEYKPRLVNPNRPKDSAVMVKTPFGIELSADSSELADEVSFRYGRKLTVLRMGRGAYHSQPVSLVSTTSLRAVEDRVGYAVDRRRFRENVIVETKNDNPFPEDEWEGYAIKFGEGSDGAILYFRKLDVRCRTIDFDPETGEDNPEILTAVREIHESNLGIYCGILKDGPIRPGDPVYIAPILL